MSRGSGVRGDETEVMSKVDVATEMKKGVKKNWEQGHCYTSLNAPLFSIASPHHPQIWKTWGLSITKQAASWVHSSSPRLHRLLFSHRFSPSFLICPPSLSPSQAFSRRKTLFFLFLLASVETHHRIIAQGLHLVSYCYSHMLDTWVSWGWRGRSPLPFV